jgi:hypothetical protein
VKDERFKNRKIEGIIFEPVMKKKDSQREYEPDKIKWLKIEPFL